MKKILHLSDLHFGTEREGLTPLLIEDCQQLNPDVIVISGDLTQRARKNQYQSVKQFLLALPKQPILCVPGNHDIALYNLLERFFYPYDKYKKWVSASLCPSFFQDRLAILGINSVTPYKAMDGFVTDQQLLLVEQYFSSHAPDIIKIIIMHHNLIKSERHRIINDADKIINVFAKVGVNIVLSGHIHFPCIEKINKNYLQKNLYIITAGTPISFRTAKPNSYNIIEIYSDRFICTVREFDRDHFIDSKKNTYVL